MNRGSVWQHTKTRGFYVVLGQCRIEATNTPAVRYMPVNGGVEWVRPEDEFLDGRFVEVTEMAAGDRRRPTT